MPGPLPKIKVIPPPENDVHQVPKSARKGPAFWTDATGAAQKPRREPLPPQPPPPPVWEIQDKVPPPPKIFGAVSWWQISTGILLLLAFILFVILISLIVAYMQEADKIIANLPETERIEKRLMEAVRQHYMQAKRPSACKPCHNSWMQLADSCYLGTAEKMHWEKCIEHCESYGASFLIARTEAEMEFLLVETSKWLTEEYNWRISGNYWIGLKYNVTDNVWHWADGNYLHLRLPKLSRENDMSMDYCVMLGNGNVLTRGCTSLNRCLCKKAVQ
ncbi:killer cell lectin-like receptor subfamily B member 1A [Sceloporus undulatus]|uniref:killer cell lectin-like receptor subfamily B member 1A n=1 Tax=Sceloporus undulatus TaxID=8520 RepID=UPI001C4B70FA|nr:killer cell lectin-like receptor subfamily B member 1A [Sceloporus undulatus]